MFLYFSFLVLWSRPVYLVCSNDLSCWKCGCPRQFLRHDNTSMLRAQWFDNRAFSRRRPNDVSLADGEELVTFSRVWHIVDVSLHTNAWHYVLASLAPPDCDLRGAAHNAQGLTDNHSLSGESSSDSASGSGQGILRPLEHWMDDRLCDCTSGLEVWMDILRRNWSILGTVKCRSSVILDRLAISSLTMHQ